MKKITLTFLFILSILIHVNAQITYSHTNRGDAGDTIRLSSAYNVAILDFTTTGPNVIWDYSTLTPTEQHIDTLLSVTSTPFLYQAGFNNVFLYNDYVSDYAAKDDNLLSGLPISGMTVEDVLTFYRHEGNSALEVTGIGATINGTAIPFRMSNKDRILSFPLQYNDTDSCFSSLEIDVPSTVYFGEDKIRKTVVDGWGTLITPYGTFNALKTQVELEISDTISYNGFNIRIPRVEAQYNWYVNGYPYPMLQVIVGTAQTVLYIDSARVFTSVKENSNSISNLNIYPNPCNDNINISIELSDNAPIGIEILDITGKQVYSNKYNVDLGANTININTNDLPSGTYIVKVSNESYSLHKKVLISR